MEHTDIEKLEKLQCPENFSKDSFEKAKNGLFRVWRGEISASMSGLEYFDEEVNWILKVIRNKW